MSTSMSLQSSSAHERELSSSADEREQSSSADEREQHNPRKTRATTTPVGTNPLLTRTAAAFGLALVQMRARKNAQTQHAGKRLHQTNSAQTTKPLRTEG